MKLSFPKAQGPPEILPRPEEPPTAWEAHLESRANYNAFYNHRAWKRIRRGGLLISLGFMLLGYALSRQQDVQQDQRRESTRSACVYRNA